MGSATAADLRTEPVPGARGFEPEGPGTGGPIASLGSWMAILGAIRLVCGLGDYTSEWRAAMRGAGVGEGTFWQYAAEHPPIQLLVAAWPAAVGLMLVRSRWHELVKVGAVTFLVLSLGGILSAMAEWGDWHRGFVTIGSFRVTQLSLVRLSVAGLTTLLVGVVQLVLELITGLRASVWAFRSLDRAPGAEVEVDRRAATRRTRLGWMGLMGSLVFLVATVHLPGWTPYLELATRSSFLRELLIGEDKPRVRTNRRMRSAPPVWFRDGSMLYSQAMRDQTEGRYAKARDTFLRLVSLLDPLSPESLTMTERQFVSEAYNNIAWLLATCPDEGLRDGKAAVLLARRALEFLPNEGNTWNTLGVAYFRAGAMEQSRSALYRSMELRNEGSSHDWFFLAMIHEREGRKERAREWYDKAAEWKKQAQFDSDELYRFQCEAATELGLPHPDPPEHTARRTQFPTNARSHRPRGRFRHNKGAGPPR